MAAEKERRHVPADNEIDDRGSASRRLGSDAVSGGTVLTAISLPACGSSGTVRRLRSVRAAVARSAGTASESVSVNLTSGRYLVIAVDNWAWAGQADEQRDKALMLAKAAYLAYDLRSTLEQVTLTFPVSIRHVAEGDVFQFRPSDLIETAGRDQTMPRPPEPISLHLVPVGDVSSDLMAQMASRLRIRFPGPLTVLPALAVDSTRYDDRRHQAIAENLIASVQQRYAALLREPDARIIAITPDDMYIRSERWAFAFSLRDGSDHVAIVSFARMRPETFGNTPDETLLQSRLRKMVTKNIGIMCYGFPLSENPRSVLYGSIGGTDELDLMTEEFNPAD
jgi:predicted Zn-dependent protease